jgi:hypothetical protein
VLRSVPSAGNIRFSIFLVTTLMKPPGASLSSNVIKNEHNMSIYVYVAYGKYILSTSLPCREQMEGQLQSDVRPPITANDIHRRVLLVVRSFSKKYVSAQWDLASAYLCLTL